MDIDLSKLSALKDKDFSGLGLMALEGRIVIEKALEAGIEPLVIVRSDESGDAWLAKYGQSLPVHAMSPEELCGLTGFRFHHGAIALAKRPELKDFPVAEFAGDVESSYLCLWNVTDPSTVGALIRSAAGLGASGVILGPGCADPYYRKALRASMGNAFSLPLFSGDMQTLSRLAASGFDLAAATLSPRALPLGEFQPRRPFVLLVGNEGFGLPEEAVGLCRGEVYIPMAPGIDSLNVVVAGGICMYALFRRADGLRRP
jgi:tRNA G18 (ribose-2'-O)-methylase SpoU